MLPYQLVPINSSLTLQVNVLDIEKTLGTVVDAVLQVRLCVVVSVPRCTRWKMCRGCSAAGAAAVNCSHCVSGGCVRINHCRCPDGPPCTRAEQALTALPNLQSAMTQVRLITAAQEPGLPAAQREARAHALKKLGKVFQASLPFDGV